MGIKNTNNIVLHKKKIKDIKEESFIEKNPESESLSYEPQDWEDKIRYQLFDTHKITPLDILEVGEVAKQHKKNNIIDWTILLNNIKRTSQDVYSFFPTSLKMMGYEKALGEAIKELVSREEKKHFFSKINWIDTRYNQNGNPEVEIALSKASVHSSGNAVRRVIQTFTVNPEGYIKYQITETNGNNTPRTIEYHGVTEDSLTGFKIGRKSNVKMFTEAVLYTLLLTGGKIKLDFPKTSAFTGYTSKIKG